jgi:hypothetical protein
LSEVQAIGGGNVRAAIARAASRSGVDFDYLLAQARIESGLNPGARAGTSSAAGLYQFTKGTWLRTLEAHGAEHGLEWASAAIEDGRLRDPAMRSAVMALRFDPDASAAMAAELAQDNAAALTPVLGREPDPAELYLAHFLGSGGAAQFLAALQSDPQQSAAALMPKAAAANRAIFFGPGGGPRSVGGVMELLRGKVASAMERPGISPADFAGRGPESWPGSASTFAARTAEPLAPPAVSNRPSMADTLRDIFGLASAQGHASAPGFVRAAYGNLKSLGL